MTKEEYLKMYKDDKLAEICEQFDSEEDKLIAQIAELGNCVGELNKKCEELDVWNDVEKVFKKLKSLPAEEFIELYSRMKNIIESPYRINMIAYSSPCNNSITTLHS